MEKHRIGLLMVPVCAAAILAAGPGTAYSAPITGGAYAESAEEETALAPESAGYAEGYAEEEEDDRGGIGTEAREGTPPAEGTEGTEDTGSGAANGAEGTENAAESTAETPADREEDGSGDPSITLVRKGTKAAESTAEESGADAPAGPLTESAGAVPAPEESTEDGLVVIEMRTAEGTNLPVEMVLSNDQGSMTVTVRENGDKVRILPGTYTLESAVDGSGKKIASGATLTIADDGGEVYLDFKEPESEKKPGPFASFLKQNLFFIPVALVLFGIYEYLVRGQQRR